METMLMAAPVTFALYLLLSVGISAISKRLSARGVDSAGKNKAYACGEDMEKNQGQPEYAEFYKFAFFFTIMHVVALVVLTEFAGISLASALYLGVTALALFMLLRR